MKKKFYTLLLLSVMMVVCGIQTGFANDGCGFDHVHQQMMQDPVFAQQQMQKDQAIHSYVQGNQNARIIPGGCDKPAEMTVTLPVVVHIVNMSATDTLIPRSQIDSAMARINRDFANVAGFGPDTKIRFVLAKRDPNGNATSGISYIDGSQLPGYVQYGIRYASGNGVNMNELTQFNWSIGQYINVYVINTFNINLSGTLGDNNLIIKSNAFSVNNFIFAHEMGHYFNLLHTFSETGSCWQNTDCANQGDYVCDTPPYKLGENPTTGSTCYNGDISNSYNNVMGNSMINSRFTAGQKDRMRAVIYDYTWSLVMSEAQIPTMVGNEVALDAIENAETETFCGNSFVPRITLRNIGTSNLSNCKVQVYVDGVLKTTTTITAIGLLKGGNRVLDLNPTPITAGTHNIRCVLSEINGSASDYFVMNNSVCGDITFQKDNYTLSVIVPNGGTVAGSGTYSCGTQINLNAIPATNYFVFDNYMENGNVLSTVAGWSLVLETNRNITANFKLKSYTVNISSADVTKGTITTTGSTVYGSAFSAKAQCKSGCKFDGWKDKYGNFVSRDSILNFTVKTDTVLTAQFSQSITTGIQQKNIENLQLYPNPATDWVIVKGFQNKILTIYDISGTEVSVQDIVNEKIDISGLPVGMYMLRLEDQEKIVTGKLIKQ